MKKTVLRPPRQGEQDDLTIMPKKTTVLCIIDGLGINESEHGNAVSAADMVNLNRAMQKYPTATLVASGPEVGLLPGDAGNSEVGHNAIGSGQFIKQGLALLNERFESGEIFESDTWMRLAENAKKTKLNIIILLSDGRVHSDIRHLHKIVSRCEKDGIPVSIHALADGRDVTTQSVITYISQTKGKISTLAGRGRAFMDRYESNPQMLVNGFELTVNGVGTKTTDIEQSITAEYSKNHKMTDETLTEFVLDSGGLIKNGDSVLLLNYRGDRAVQTCKMFEEGKYLTPEQFSKIDKCLFVGILEYDTELKIPTRYLCPPPVINNTLTQYLCAHNVRQYTVTESVKFGHLTYFFNGNRAKKVCEKLETWQEIKSDVLPSFDIAPKMKAREITAKTIQAIQSNKYDFIKLNLSNPDMVGHSANFDATVIACQVVDECLGEIIAMCEQTNTNLIITSDHGNAEEMLDQNGKPKSAHTNSDVPMIIIGSPKIKNGGLTNIAATICKLLALEPSPHFNPPLL